MVSIAQSCINWINIIIPLRREFCSKENEAYPPPLKRNTGRPIGFVKENLLCIFHVKLSLFFQGVGGVGQFSLSFDEIKNIKIAVIIKKKKVMMKYCRKIYLFIMYIFFHSKITHKYMLKKHVLSNQTLC